MRNDTEIVPKLFRGTIISYNTTITRNGFSFNKN